MSYITVEDKVAKCYRAAWATAKAAHVGYGRQEAAVAQDPELAAARAELAAARAATEKSQADLASALGASGLWGFCPWVSDGVITGVPSALTRAGTHQEAVTRFVAAGFDLRRGDVCPMPGIL